MRTASNFIDVAGSDKFEYLRVLDKALEVLVTGLKNFQNEYLAEIIGQFGRQHTWDMHRLPSEIGVYASLSDMIDVARKNYAWFSAHIDPENPGNNRNYFDKIELSSYSGLPWLFSIMQLHKIKENASELLRTLPEYENLAAQLKSMLMGDEMPLSELEREATKLHESALKRNYVDLLKDAELLHWSTSGSSKPRAEKVMELGAETLWKITYTRFSPATATFHFYVIDAWQDILEPQIFDGKLTAEFESAFQFGEETAAHYILGDIDSKFKSIHPVHVSRGILGPFESKYTLNRKTLPVIEEVLEENPELMLLRFKRQYSLAPKDQETKQGIRQVLYRADWNDEVIVCPEQCTSRIASAIMGTSVRIFPM